MNKYIKEVVKVVLVGGALAAALTGCCLWNSEKCCCGKDGGKCACGKAMKASPMCNDRACSNAGGGQ